MEPYPSPGKPQKPPLLGLRFGLRLPHLTRLHGNELGLVEVCPRMGQGQEIMVGRILGVEALASQKGEVWEM